MSNTKGTSAIVPPQGGGAQSGLGEKFSPDLFTGTGNFSVPIAVPPGRNGFQPELTLGYSSGNGNGVFGMGWALGIPGVTRKTSRGIPVYNDQQDIFILSGSEDLVPVRKTSASESTLGETIIHEKTYYRPRTEGLFARIVHHKKSSGEDYWEVRSKNGLISYYGSDSFESQDPCIIANPENRKAIFGWCLSKTVDPFGNEIIYEYERELVTQSSSSFEPHAYDQLYLTSIKYAQYIDEGDKKYVCEVKFNYEERQDPFSSYRQGFEMRTTKRCSTIEMYTHTDEIRKTKTYHFDYLTELPLNGVSLLKAVRVEGNDGDDSEFMPPLDFGYSTFVPSRRGLGQVSGPIPAFSLASPGYELADLNGNGLPDLLQLDGIAARYWLNKGGGKFSNPKNLSISPAVQLGQPGVQLIDANGNGRNDLLVNNGLMTGYYPGEFGAVWSERLFQPYSKAPSVNFANPEVQLMDLNGDGMTDVLRNGAKFECFLNDPVKGFDKVRVADKTFANFSFADPRIRFADMTGDGLQDIVLISSGRVQYWPNMGYGRFGKKVNMTNAPRFPEQYNPAQVLVGDLDGDGLADIAFVENNSVTLYINQSANGFSEGTKITNTPAVYDPNSLRITDLHGTGQPGILWSMPGTDGRAGKMYFLDFTNNNKPYVLEEMNNNMGSVTRVQYGSSIQHYLRDEKNPATRWKTELPFPVQVVNKVEVLDLLSGGKLATEYNYHHGYWDGAEREFRGFGRVDTIDTETFERFNNGQLTINNGQLEIDNKNSEIPQTGVSAEFYTPPVMTKSWFEPGPVGTDFTRWHEVNFSDEYWQGDQNVLKRTQQEKTLLASLSRRARRDALRTLRGTMLRSETYALDGTPLQSRPYTVSENLMSVRLEFSPEEDPALFKGWEKSGQGYWAGTGYIFFPFNVGQRTTQYERGIEPMHSMSFVKDYDAYGQALGQLSVGLPRHSSPLSGSVNGKYLATYSESEFIYADIEDGQYMVDRTKRSVSYDATKPASTSVFAFRDTIYSEAVFENPPALPVIGCSLNYYDGDAFEGLPYGEIGEFGTAVRSEALVLTDTIISEAYSTTPECFQATPDWSSNYPAAFEGLLQNDDERLGYKDRRTGYPNHIEGWYIEGGRMKYDWQDVLIENPVGLMLESKDVFDNTSTVAYDDYSLLPLTTRQYLNGTDYLETTAEYDYRVMQAKKVTDQNDNITEFDFSPLGLLRATAVIGKGTQGDYKAATGTFYERFAPSSQMEYDFFAFVNEGNPVWVKTTQREQHWQDEEDSPTIVKVEYSDGFGRLLQTRAQAEDVIFGNETFGSSGLPANQDSNAPTVGIERDSEEPLNVVVSGWQIYNNKGKVVEQYEPFFDKGFEYVLPQLSETSSIIPPQLGVKIKMYYDPIGRVVKTINPDNSQQWVIYGEPNALDTPLNFDPTPWVNYAYDANDLAPITNPGSNVNPTHWYTPKSSLVDALGRTIQTTEHNAHFNGTSYEDVDMYYTYDVRGNLLEIKDPYQRKVFEHVYDLRQPQEDTSTGSASSGEKQPLTPLWTKHIDQGISVLLPDAPGKPIESSDAKGAVTLSVYDRLSRQTHLWAKDKTGESFTLRQVMEYGDSSGLTDPKDENLNGQIYKHYDEAGLVTFNAYDFKANLLEKEREVISDTDLLSVFDGPPTDWNIQYFRVNWDISLTLEGSYISTMEYDALNRVTKMIYPEDVDSDRKELIPTYNRAGALESVKMDGNNYVNHIAYNAQGKRILIAYENGIMTRYAYDNRTFRIVRQRSETYTKTDWTYTSGGSVQQDTAHFYDLIGNIIKLNEKTTGCGVGGTDTLVRDFEYDPLYRLISGTGRENSPTITPIWDDRYRSTDNATTTAYTQNYSYDKLGNIQVLQHLGNNNFTRNFNYTSTNNQLQSVDIGMSNFAFSYDACGNQISETTSRHFEWSVDNRLRSFYVQTGTSEPTQYAQYLYDAGGTRVKKIVRTAGGNYTSRVYIDDVFEYKTDGTDEQNLLHIMDDQTRISMIRLGDTFGDTTPAIKYNIDDYLQNSALLLETTGALINKEEYYPFGETSFGSYAKKRYKFSGKERDEESGLYYCKYRYHSAWTCRFISVDPLAPKYPHYCSYSFAGNKVISAVEFEGLEEVNLNTDKITNSTNELINKGTINGEKPKHTIEQYKEAISNIVTGLKHWSKMGYKKAISLMSNYLSGGGQDLDVPLKDLESSVTFSAADKRLNEHFINDILDVYSDMPNGEYNYDVNEQWDANFRFDVFSETDLFLSFGTGKIRAFGQLKIIKSDTKFEVYGTLYKTFYDYYDWNPKNTNAAFEFFMGYGDNNDYIMMQDLGAESFWSRTFYTTEVSGGILFNSKSQKSYFESSVNRESDITIFHYWPSGIPISK